MHFDNGQLRVLRHGVVKVICCIPAKGFIEHVTGGHLRTNEPEHRISYLIHLPRSHKGNITRNGMFEHVFSPIELTMFLADAGNLDTFGYTAVVVADGYRTLLHPSRSASGSKKRGYPCGVCTQTFGKGTLRYEFQGYLPLEIKLLKVLIPRKEEPSRIRPERIVR